MIISVDGGTTNTRLSLIEKGKVLSTVKIRIGAGNQPIASGGNPYWQPLHDGVRTLLQQNGLDKSDVEAMVYSGMICSETGLHTVPHILAPANADQVARAMEELPIPEIADIPMLFVPGVRTDGHSPSEIDIMRGEETELFGICQLLGVQRFVAVMPGSHTKLVRMEEVGTISSFQTALTGELIRAVAEHTILRTALYDVFPKHLDKAYLLEGFRSCAAYGLNKALFEVRIRQKFSEQAPEQLFSFLCGACLHGDMDPILKVSEGFPIYVGGSDPFRSAYAYLLRMNGAEQVFEISDSVAEHAAAYGAELLFTLRPNAK